MFESSVNLKKKKKQLWALKRTKLTLCHNHLYIFHSSVSVMNPSVWWVYWVQEPFTSQIFLFYNCLIKTRQINFSWNFSGLKILKRPENKKDQKPIFILELKSHKTVNQARFSLLKPCQWQAKLMAHTFTALLKIESKYFLLRDSSTQNSWLVGRTIF